MDIFIFVCIIQISNTSLFITNVTVFIHTLNILRKKALSFFIYTQRLAIVVDIRLIKLEY